MTPENLPLQAWTPQSAPSAVLLCLHGLGLHCGSYSSFGRKMSELGVATYASDVRGCGRWRCNSSACERSPELDLDQALFDAGHILKHLRKVHAGVPLFVLGESMGGALALQAAAAYTDLINGLILSAPARTLYEHKFEVLRVGFELLVKGGAPVSLARALVARASMQPQHRQVWLSDELSRVDFSARELWQLDKFMQRAQQSARLIQETPALIIQGEGDRVVTPQGTLLLYQQLATPNKDLILLSDAEHLIFQHPQVHERAVELVHQWMLSDNRQIKLRAAS